MARERASVELDRLGRAGPNAGEMDLLRAATLDPEPAAAAWRRWTERFDIDTAHHRSSDLLPAVSANLPREAMGSETGRIRGIRRRTWADNQFGFVALLEAIDVLAAVGIDAVVVKGAAIANSVYPEPGTRAMADVDLWVGPENFVGACDALLASGWRRLDAVEGPFFHAVAVVDEQGRSVDVHRWMAFPRFCATPERNWWDRAVEHEVQGRRISMLASSDELLLTILHGLLTNSASASRWPVDVVMMCRSGSTAAGFWEDVVAAAGEIEVGPIVADALAMCRRELGAEVPDIVLDALADGSCERWLAVHWALCRRGITPEWRMRRYARLEREAGRRPTVWGYASRRTEAVRARGVSSVLRGRVGRARQIVRDRTRR